MRDPQPYLDALAEHEALGQRLLRTGVEYAHEIQDELQHKLIYVRIPAAYVRVTRSLNVVVKIETPKGLVEISVPYSNVEVVGEQLQVAPEEDGEAAPAGSEAA